MKQNLLKTIKNKWLLTVLLIAPLLSSAQLTGVKTINNGVATGGNNYTTVAAAINALNTNGVGTGGVIFNVTGVGGENLTAPLSITATGTVGNPITFKNLTDGTYTIVAPVGANSIVSTTTWDGIWNIIGGSYITIDGFTLIELPANTTTQTMMEYGFALYKSKNATVYVGSQHNTIKNCTISLNKNNTIPSNPILYNSGSVGILAVNASINNQNLIYGHTKATEANSYNTFISNNITNCNTGIALIGGLDTNPNSWDVGNTIGGATTEGNTITNFGGGSVNVTGATGIYIAGQTVFNISNNVINNNTGQGAANKTTICGIYNINDLGSLNNTISYNTIILKSAAVSADIIGIQNSVVNCSINNNIIQNCSYIAATTGSFYGIRNIGTNGNFIVKTNTISNNTITTTGSFYGIYNGVTPATLDISANTISGNKQVGAGTFTGIDAGNSGTLTMNGNAINNNTKTGAGNIFCTSAGTSSSITFANNTISNNTCSHSSTGLSFIYGFYNTSGTSTTQVFDNNTISNLTITANSGTGNQIYGLAIESLAPHGVTISRNKINGFVFNGINAASLIGMSVSHGGTINIFKNEIRDFSAAGADANVKGLYVSNGTTWNISNNLIGDLKASAANNLSSIVGIAINANSGTFNMYYNTVYLDATSTGNSFGSTALYAPTSPTVNLRNNIFVNKSTPGVNGFAVAYQRSGSSLTTYATTSNNNLFYAGIPSLKNLIFHDGNPYQTITSFKTLVSGREAASITENPHFLSTSNPTNFLHINPAISTLIEGGGSSITNYTDDYDGNLRSGTTPDIGADEFTGTVPLPLDLISFAGKASDHANTLSWITANESYTSHFDVERMVNGVDFVKVSEIAAAGDSKAQLNYSFTDKDLVKNVAVYYYRLKMVDQNGDFTYSNATPVSGALKSKFDAFIYPNPSAGFVTLNLLNPDKEEARFDVFNLSGVKVNSGSIENQNVFYTKTYDWTNLAKGMYALKVTTASTVKTIKMIIQ